MTETQKADFNHLFLEGIEHFNRHEFWDAHESWEQIWLEADESAQFLQGLIQIAAAYHHIQRGTIRGAGRLFEAAMKRLVPYPEGYCGLLRGDMLLEAREAEAAVLKALEEGGSVPVALAERPRLHMATDWAERIPGNENW